ncbi:elongation factor P [Candidatus Dojkabacteria bacterium]|nr:elongation factor P [Candidatus Dojkabacteria bacterium]
MAIVVPSNDLRKGMIFTTGGESYLVLEYSHMKKGRGMATIRIKGKNVNTGSIVEKTFSSSERVELADAHRKEAQYLYADDSSVYFMDKDDFSQFSFPFSELSWERNFIKEGTKVVVLFINDKPVGIEIPKSVVLKIEQTSDAVKGDTSSNAMKEAVLETGYKVQVPLFLKMGEFIKLNTESGTYTSKAEEG